MKNKMNSHVLFIRDCLKLFHISKIIATQFAIKVSPFYSKFIVFIYHFTMIHNRVKQLSAQWFLNMKTETQVNSFPPLCDSQIADDMQRNRWLYIHSRKCDDVERERESIVP